MKGSNFKFPALHPLDEINPFRRLHHCPAPFTAAGPEAIHSTGKSECQHRLFCPIAKSLQIKPFRAKYYWVRNCPAEMGKRADQLKRWRCVYCCRSLWCLLLDHCHFINLSFYICQEVKFYLLCVCLFCLQLWAKIDGHIFLEIFTRCGSTYSRFHLILEAIGTLFEIIL